MSYRDEVLSEARAFQRSRAILTGAELDFFTRLDGHASTARDLAGELGLDERATTRVLDVLVTLGFLNKDGDRYGNTEKGSFLSSRHPETVRPMVLHASHMWMNWSHLTEAVRQGRNPHRIRASEQGGETLRNFIGAMHVVGRDLSRNVAVSYDASRFQSLLDIGGGSGTYTIAFLEKNPRLRAVVFDLPQVVQMARERVEAEGFSSRVTLVAGNFYEDELPSGCDLALLSAIIHQNSPVQNLDLYRKIHRALLPGGALLIRDHIMDENRSCPPAGAVFALNMLVGTDGGDTFTFGEVKETLALAGFRDIRQLRRGETMDGLVEATKPV